MQGTTASARYLHSCAAVPEGLVVFGGYDLQGEYVHSHCSVPVFVGRSAILFIFPQQSVLQNESQQKSASIRELSGFELQSCERAYNLQAH